MRQIFIFAIGASIVGIVFFVSLIELIITIRRRKAHHALEARIKELKTTYNESVNHLLIEGEGKLEETEKQVTDISGKVEGEKAQITTEYEAKLEKLKEEADKEVAHAKAAKLKAEEYLASRKDEVEHDLMDLVMSVTKKVLPESLDYQAHKELVLEALRDVRSEGKH
jgi:flagellar biosynthesis/type III secretory pathway protein FliH